ncbi:hypothetical protein [Azospirillum tabaci]|uniref:hypothetical protein n=1 Tax=Azospirillum tabaci TaxID=2752310 RepID=UPI001660C09F|nr:hypothetical protein [Azospirillum tabaci]
MIHTAVETDIPVHAGAASQDSEARFHAFMTASSEVVYRMSPDWTRMRQFNGRGFLADTAEPTGHWMERYIHPADQATVQAAIRHAIGTCTS